MCAARMEKEGSKDVLSDNALRGQDDPRDVLRSRALATFQRCSRTFAARSAGLSPQSQRTTSRVLAIPTAGKEPQSILPPETRDAKAKGFSIFFAEIMMRCALPTLSAFSRTCGTTL